MFLATIRKEILLLLRDVHALAVLFLMPLVFVVIMSLAMPDASKSPSPLLSVAVVNETPSVYSHALSDYLLATPAIAWKTDALSLADWQQQLKDKTLDAIIVLPQQQDDAHFDTTLTHVYLAPSMNAQSRQLFDGVIKAALGKTRLLMILLELNGAQSAEESIQLQQQAEQTTLKDSLEHHYVFSHTEQATPNAVQQSVPAWLVFGMFFVLIPLSATTIVELQQGTLRRLHSMNVSASQFLLGKLVPYFIINQLQLLLMLACGRFLIPLLGGDALVINGTLSALFLVSAACSLAALGFAMLISVLVKSTEQATALGGAANIILAAIGGIMIPKFIMPPVMQAVANISPMSWALDGFLAVILYGNTWLAVLPYVTALLFFAIISFTLAVMRFKQLSSYGQ